MKFMGFDWYTYISNSVGTIWENEDPNGNSTNGIYIMNILTYGIYWYIHYNYDV